MDAGQPCHPGSIDVISGGDNYLNTGVCFCGGLSKLGNMFLSRRTWDFVKAVQIDQSFLVVDAAIFWQQCRDAGMLEKSLFKVLLLDVLNLMKGNINWKPLTFSL